MLRLRLACVKHITLALFAIALLMGAVEVGLRVHHSWETQAKGERSDFQSLAVPSWKCHHALKPLKSTVSRNPDTRLPVGIRTNSLGLRGEPIAIPKPRDVFRIVYLGDETVFASEVAEEETFCRLIAEELNKLPHRRFEVVNAGISGYCPLLSYLQFKHSLAGLQPDLLILNLDMSDVADDHHYRRHARLGAKGLPLVCAHPALQPDRASDSPGQRFLLLNLLKQQLGLLPADEPRVSDRNEIATAAGRYAWTREERPDWAVYIAQALAPIVDLEKLANQLSCPLLVSLSPVPWQVSEGAMPDARARQKWGISPSQVYDPRLSMDPVTQFLEAHSIAYCDLSVPFREADQPEGLFHETVPRFSRRGHVLFARVVSSFLKESHLRDRHRSEEY
jgi:hypothetical protein